MTDVSILFPDAQLAARDLLRRLLADQPGVTVSTRFPEASDERPATPYVRVALVGNSRDSRLAGRASLRVQVWHRDEGLGVRLALLIEARLLASSSPEIRGFAAAAGPIPTEDPDTGAPLTFLTITARLRPGNLPIGAPE